MEKVTAEKRFILENMLQLYLHEITAFFPIEFNSEIGLYEYDNFGDYFTDENKMAYFILVEDKIGGFVLVDKIDHEFILQEIFVLNNYKNKGIGYNTVKELLDMCKGQWVIKSLPNSKGAENFWMKTIKDLTDDNFKMERIGKYNRAVITFNNLEG